MRFKIPKKKIETFCHVAMFDHPAVTDLNKYVDAVQFNKFGELVVVSLKRVFVHCPFRGQLFYVI